MTSCHVNEDNRNWTRVFNGRRKMLLVVSVEISALPENEEFLLISVNITFLVACVEMSRLLRPVCTENEALRTVIINDSGIQGCSCSFPFSAACSGIHETISKD